MQPGRKQRVKEPELIDKSLEVKDFNTIESMRYVGAPKPGVAFNEDFDTLWSVTFTINPTAIINTENWFV